MQYSKALAHGTLLRRYKRFLADVQLDDGTEITLHCPNTGSMKNCLFPGETVWFSTSDNPKRKYAHTWELSNTPDKHLIGINTGRANALAEEAINSGIITELTGYDTLKREVKYGEENSRIDILLSSDTRPSCYIEVKSCTLLDEGSNSGTGYFPDSVTVRGQKHLRELIHMVEQGHRAVLLFVVQHSGITSVSPARHIDAAYSDLLTQALDAGVEVIAYQTHMSPQESQLLTPCPVIT
ncbi:DNA/RNA nuclease SfsA [Shewanella sp. SR44-3]|uniref:DNA/RNA nuclease SfsA n=1 Tax=unclassified Shewanella TaxID=196818 RepID=UPI0015FCF2B8|nr:DNA/RNA nuclease SfsA [Shewanella sp. SR44-3]MBB1268254.1 DNA/RNA nuclease SfsA [Shewanella sp. SR44-3]